MATEGVDEHPSLPSYTEMIMKAIAALNEENGSNKSSIAKYIEDTYSELPADHLGLLTHHLNMMKDSGELVFWKNNFSKPDPNAPPRRGRGRPPKPKEPMSECTIVSSPSRPRGRPPKDPNAPPKPPKGSSGRKPRGRPRKMAKPTGSLVAATSPAASSGRPRGRPPKVKPQQLPEVSVR